MAKKDFQSITNPALAFITPEAPAPELQPIKEKEGKAQLTKGQQPTFNRYGQESKTKRLNLVLKPSTHRALLDIVKAKADPYISVNSLINDLLEQYINDNT